MRRNKKCFPTVSGIGTQIDYRFIDKAIRPLIRVLNAHPYVQTFSCCEGHGLGRNSFYVWLGAKGREARDFLREGARMAWHAEFGHEKEKCQRPTQKDFASSRNSYEKIWEWGVLIESVRGQLPKAKALGLAGRVAPTHDWRVDEACRQSSAYRRAAT